MPACAGIAEETGLTIAGRRWLPVDINFARPRPWNVFRQEVTSGLAALSVAFAAAGQPAFAGGDEPTALLELVRQRVSQAAGRPVDVRIETRATRGDWTLMCGVPLEVSGRPFAIERSRLAASEYGASFCALLREAGPAYEIVEFDIGSNDMPAVDWVEKYDLSPALLTSK